MSWNIGDEGYLFLLQKTKLGLYHVELRRSKPKAFPEKFTLTLVESQQLPHIEKVDSKDESSCFKWTIQNGRRKLCINVRSDTENTVCICGYHSSCFDV